MTRGLVHDGGLSRERTALAWQRTLLLACTAGGVALKLAWPLRPLSGVLGAAGLLLMVCVTVKPRRTTQAAALLAFATALWCAAGLLEVAG